MKSKYNKPRVVSNGKNEGVIPVGLPGAVAAFTAGVAAGVQVKKMLSGYISWGKGKQLVEGGALA